VLAKELENFRVKVTAAGAEAYEAWKGGQHDDLVLAVGLAGWAAERGSPGGWVLPDRPPISRFRMFGLDPWSAALRPDRFPWPG
jgi:hypothetical protein